MSSERNRKPATIEVFVNELGQDTFKEGRFLHAFSKESINKFLDEKGFEEDREQLLLDLEAEGVFQRKKEKPLEIEDIKSIFNYLLKPFTYFVWSQTEEQEKEPKKKGKMKKF